MITQRYAVTHTETGASVTRSVNVNVNVMSYRRDSYRNTRQVEVSCD